MAPTWFTMPARLRKAPAPPLPHLGKRARESDEDGGAEEKTIAMETHASASGKATTTLQEREAGAESGLSARAGDEGARPHDGHAAGAKHDPEEYHEAKKQLKKAVQECYRCV